MYPILVWALVALIGRVDCKCSLAPIVDDERSIAYACIHGDLNDLGEIPSETEWIEFSVSRFNVIPDNAFSRFPNLRRLSFYNCHVNVIAPNAFAGLHRLEWLILHGTRIQVVQSAWFRHLPNLRKLIFDRCGLVHVETDAFRMIPRLETLSLRDNDLDCLPTEELAYLRILKRARIDGNPWICECRRRMDRFFRDRSIVQEVECMREIDACKNVQCMTQIGIPVFPLSSAVQRWKTYEREKMATPANEFQTSVLDSLDRLPDKTTWIEITGLTIHTLPKYAFFRFGNSLRNLELNNCSISTIESGAFAGLHRLERLSLVGNQLPVVGADWFRDLLAVRLLVLRWNDIERFERTALSNLAHSLRQLDLRNNRLRCLDLEELGQLRHLERLELTGNPWTCSCRRNLQSVLTKNNVGFEIGAGRCIENESDIVPEVTGEGRHQQPVDEGVPAVGKVHWTSFEETMKQTNVTIVRPPMPTPGTQISIQTPRPPLYQGTCRQENMHGTRPAYACIGIGSLEELNAIPPTAHSIRIILSNVKKIPSKTFARFNGYLSRLELRDCGIEKIEYGAFSGLYNLQYLSLRNNQLDSITSDEIQGLSNLRHLDLSRNQIYRITNDAFDALPYLTGLDISENLMNCVGVEHMANRLRHLTTLKVTNNPWSCLCGTKLAEFLASRRIPYDRNTLVHTSGECHDVPGSIVSTTEGTTVVSTPSTVPTTSEVVETVMGTCTSYDDDIGIRYRCTGGNLLLLETIPSDVVRIEFHEGHLPHLPPGAFSRFVHLRELVIRNSGLTIVDRGAFEGLEKLENLTIQDNPLESVGSSWFASNNLARLDLRGNSIKYIAPGAFQRLHRLAYLNLEGNDLKCIFTSDLNDMPEVYVVEFSGNPLKWRCRLELEQFLEARKIKFVRVENSCEGKKLVRNLLLQNKTDGDFSCPSDCSAAAEIGRFVFLFVAALPLFVWAL